MTDTKYEITEKTTITNGKVLKRIRSLKDFDNVKKGQYGGYVESERNLSQKGSCWVNGLACVYEDALVCEDAMVSGSSIISGKAIIGGSASASRYGGC